MKTKKSSGNNNAGAIVLIVCGVLTVLLMVGCIFFPDEIFGMFLNK